MFKVKALKRDEIWERGGEQAQRYLTLSQTGRNGKRGTENECAISPSLSLSSPALPTHPIFIFFFSPVEYKLSFYSSLTPLPLFGSPMGTSEAQRGLLYACVGSVFYDMV